MAVILFFLGTIIFLFSLFLCNIILNLFEKVLLKTQYVSTPKLRCFLSCLITLILGVTVGKMIIGRLI
jgi:hypothetical protein